MSLEDIVEGSWQLDLWNAEGHQWKLPDAHGRFVLRDGVVIFMAQRPSLQGKYTRYAYGRYELTDTTWSYGYLHDTILRETETGIDISRDLPWEGLRIFNIVRHATGAQLSCEGGMYKVTYEADRLFYFEAERLVRAWTRI
jgi:hypothetical protein